MTGPSCLKISTLVAVSLAIALLSVSLSAASSYQDAFNNRLARPNDTDSLGHFVEIAVESGQYDQALSTIEQHLITYPRDAQARLIAGRLYFHVGSYDLARRQVNAAISIGTLGPDQRSEAEKLIGLIDNSIAGNTGYVSLTVGAEVVHTNFSPAAAVSDRTDFNPYGEIYGTLRHDLNTATDDAIILTGRARVSRQFGDFSLTGTGGVFTAGSGRVSIAWDKGLPNSGITSLRLNLSAFGDYYAFQDGAAIREYGVLAKFTARPSVDATLFANFGYANLSTSDLLFTDHRYRAEIGGAHRVSGKHALGTAIRSEFDYTDSGTFVGRIIEGQVSYAGLLWSKPDGPVWTHRITFGAGHAILPDLTATPGTTFEGPFWVARWDHVYEINDRNRIDFNLRYQQLNLDTSSRDQSSLGVGLSYTHTFR